MKLPALPHQFECIVTHQGCLEQIKVKYVLKRPAAAGQ